MHIEISSSELDKVIADHVRRKLGIKNKLKVYYFVGQDDKPPFEAQSIAVTVEVPNKLIKE